MNEEDKTSMEGEDSKNQVHENGTTPVQNEKAGGSQIQGPTVGIDPQGYFFVMIHSSAGYLSMLGFLEEAREWLMSKHKGSLRNSEKNKSEILKPKGFRGFKLWS